jgi:5,6-dimethylbenzimidazole synthase
MKGTLVGTVALVTGASSGRLRAMTEQGYTDSERRAIYKVMSERRDIRRFTDCRRRHEIHALVDAERHRTAAALGEREAEFLALKVEGILECAELLVVALADDRERHVFGRRTMPYMDLASVSCAIQNLWLAARAEGLGMGWVSLFEPDELAQVLALPSDAEPVAVLCLGPVPEFPDRPMLEIEKWATARPLSEMVHENSWSATRNAGRSR